MFEVEEMVDSIIELVVFDLVNINLKIVELSKYLVLEIDNNRGILN